jgi:phosphoadenylyl-sulfate reductase (thioredoxin)
MADVKTMAGWSLDQKEAYGIQILTEALNTFDRTKIALAFTGGKDSLVCLDLLRRASEGSVPIPVLHVDTTVKFPEIYEYRDRMARDWKLNLIVHINEQALKEGPKPSDADFCIFCTQRLKTEALQQAVQQHGWQALITGVRWDEHEARSAETFFSKRDDHVRVHPILQFTEDDVWAYISRYQLPYCSLYDKGYRSIGCMPCTEPIPDEGPERSGRGHEKEALMGRLRALGYF